MNKKNILIILIVLFALSGCKEKDKTNYPLRGNPTDYRKLDVKSLLATADHAYLGAQDYAKALDFYDKVLKRVPTNLHALFRSGKVLRLMNRDNHALKRFEKYLKAIKNTPSYKLQDKRYNQLEVSEATDHIRAILTKRNIRRTTRDFTFLITSLEDRLLEIREAAIKKLYRLTGQKFNFWASGTKYQRAGSVHQWREWNSLREIKRRRRRRR